ncbi:helix-turn-helix domain-containing protein [Sphingobacterium sp. CZ-2]|uniref:helix-turn-helix domain-containing protein n=1 Tax=Sphingobacterium sp. CZ-2 TaxID=2557994 RepID=UPI00106F5C4A|nr:helix-turn-helix domain-containing protein [Sphingobacterium sp. CZ-2]QBR13628.1 AraC family transcriptional regulator [Sphingobacterium sp. CZ-2]
MEFGIKEVNGGDPVNLGKSQDWQKNYYKVLFINESGGSLMVEHRKLELEPLSLVFIGKGIRVSARKGEVRIFHMLYFSQGFAARTESELSFLLSFRPLQESLEGYSILKLTQQYSCYYHFMVGHLALAKSNYDRAVYRDLAFNMVRQILLMGFIYMKQEEYAELLSPGGESRLVGDFKILVQKFVHRQRKVSYYADQLRVSPRKLNEVTKRLTGRTPKELINESLGELEKRMLTSGAKSIKQIAWELGFSNENNFSASFTKRFGISPKEYRKKWRL